MIILSSATGLYSLKYYGLTGAIFAFTMLPTRIFQFAAGIMAYYIQVFIGNQLVIDNSKYIKLIDKFIFNRMTVNFITLLVTVIILCPLSLNQSIVQTFIVLLAAVLIVACKPCHKNKKAFYWIAAKPLILIGDASYSLYITHWVLVTAIQAKFDDVEQGKLFCLFLAFKFL